MKKLPIGDKLYKRAEELNVSFDSIGDDDSILQKRGIETERAKREGRLWIIALISAIASVISAIAAWCAVLIR